MEFRQVRTGASVSLSVPNGTSKRLPANFFGEPDYADGPVPDSTGAVAVDVDGDYEFEFACEAVWASALFGGESTEPGQWVLYINGVEGSGPMDNGTTTRLRLKAGDVVAPAPYATGIEGSTSGNPQAVSLSKVGGLAHWAGRQYA